MASTMDNEPHFDALRCERITFLATSKMTFGGPETYLGEGGFSDDSGFDAACLAASIQAAIGITDAPCFRVAMAT